MQGYLLKTQGRTEIFSLDRIVVFAFYLADQLAGLEVQCLGYKLSSMIATLSNLTEPISQSVFDGINDNFIGQSEESQLP